MHIRESVIFLSRYFNFGLNMTDSTFKEKFAAHLRSALKAKFGRLPSAPFVAITFNRQIPGNGVSGETVRRWLRGVSLPRYEHMQILSHWLSLNLDLVLRPGSTVQTVDRPVPPREASKLEQIIFSLDPKTQEALLNLFSKSPMLFPRKVRSEGDWEARSGYDAGPAVYPPPPRRPIPSKQPKDPMTRLRVHVAELIGSIETGTVSS